MSRSPASFLSRILLATMLAMLAVAFAVEAKLAWYGPMAGPGSEVRAAKAMPTLPPKLVPHGIPAPDPHHRLIAFAVLHGLAALPAWAELPARPAATPRACGLTSACYFTPALFLRPPPAL